MVCFILAIIISAIKINIKGFTGFNNPDKLDSRLFYDLRKIYYKLFKNKKVASSYDLEEKVDVEKNIEQEDKKEVF